MRWVAVSEFKIGWQKVKLLAMTENEQFTNCFSYEFNHTPCEEVLAQDRFCYFAEVQSKFPLDQDLQTMGVIDYAGKRFTDSNHQVAGHLVLLHDQVIEDEARVEKVVNALTTFLHLEWPN